MLDGEPRAEKKGAKVMAEAIVIFLIVVAATGMAVALMAWHQTDMLKDELEESMADTEFWRKIAFKLDAEMPRTAEEYVKWSDKGGEHRREQIHPMLPHAAPAPRHPPRRPSESREEAVLEQSALRLCAWPGCHMDISHRHRQAKYCMDHAEEARLESQRAYVRPERKARGE